MLKDREKKNKEKAKAQRSLSYPPLNKKITKPDYRKKLKLKKKLKIKMMKNLLCGMKKQIKNLLQFLN